MAQAKAQRNLKLSKLLNKPQRYLKYRPNNTWVLPEQCIGVEIELENVRPNTLLQFESLGSPRWLHHEDPMLRNRGQEFTTSDGLFGEDLFEAVNEFYKFLPDSGWVVSERTGIHIHLDVSDLELVTTFRNMVALYLILEQPLFNFIGDDRRNNIHCLPWYKAQANLEPLGNIFNPQIGETTFQSCVHHLDRYSALNFASLEKYGTLEFRHMKTTLDKAKLVQWINLIMSIKRFAKDYSGKTEDLITWGAKYPKSLGVAVFGAELVASIWGDENFASLCASGTTIATDVIVLYNPVTEEDTGWEDSGISLKDGLANKFFAGAGNKAPTKKNLRGYKLSAGGI